ncbi:cytochrome P450 [Ampelomyces quisqualis]|uniref:Cytochrome P450 n=1 Tax=Ampelomyces quisqualis TaxID=50730 RepID=A0A6A5Q9R7_AMPQU|nr:cytochrome P450 [Ampelomyces quisqualis]
MNVYVTIGFIVGIFAYAGLQLMLHLTQDKREPCILESRVPFLDSAIGIMNHRANYLAKLKAQYKASIHTIRMPFQRLYIVHTPHLIQIIQNKANASTFVPNLLDFGMMFSGLKKESKVTLAGAFGLNGNAFTKSVHKHLLPGASLLATTSNAVEKLCASLPNNLDNSSTQGLLELVRHELTMALTGAVYGPENPYNDSKIEASWYDFVPGINHLLYSPFPNLTARAALRARDRVIGAFQKYFETGGHHYAMAMIPEMYEANISHGLASDEAAKMEMATSLAMLSSGSNTAFWLLYQIFSDCSALHTIRQELLEVSTKEETSGGPQCRVLSLNLIRDECPTMSAMLNETLRYHSSVINIKQVQHDTTFANQYLLKKDAIVMIPGQSIHHEKDIWGPSADYFDHLRFLDPASRRNLSSTSAFRPFGAGASMCPGRHFSMNVICSLVAMIVLQYNIMPSDGKWRAPTKCNADLWNAMPKPDRDLAVRIVKKVESEDVQWRFVWAEEV